MRFRFLLLPVAVVLFGSARLPAQVDGATQITVVETDRAATTRLGQAGVFREITVARPRPSTTLVELEKVNPGLSAVVPGLSVMMPTATVSDRYRQLYEAKLKTLRSGQLLTTHNYFDCDTILRLKHPETGQRVLLLQADMDCVTDGSDPGRAAKLSDYDFARTSDWYLPETAWSWAGSSGTNPFLQYYPDAKSRLSQYRAEFVKESARDGGVVWRELIGACDAQIYRVEQRGLLSSTRTGLKSRRYLVATRDPFVVLPKGWVVGKEEYSANIGDYAAVVYRGKIYPAVLGDAGPNDKVGEASLRIAQMLNPKANGKTRAVSDLSVTYLFFPKSSVGRGTPNHTAWRQKCAGLLERIGGLGKGVALHDWAE